MRHSSLLTGLLALLLVGSAHGQGIGVQFVNFEAPAHKPITVTTLGEDSYLLVCNVPDNSVEVYLAADDQFLFRVPVGQRPVTVAVKPTALSGGGRRVYVANWLGDSITVFDLLPGGLGAPTSATFKVLRTENVGDEPVGLAFMPPNPAKPITLPGGLLHERLFITFSAQAAWGLFNPDDLTPVTGATRQFAANGDLYVVGILARNKDPKLMPDEVEATRVFVTGSSSDTLAMVEPTDTGLANWTVTRIDVSHPTDAFSNDPVTPNLGGVLRGPRALALKASGITNDPDDLLYVYNRLENSVTVLDPNFTPPASPVLRTFLLASQPEPPHVVAGRKLLYASELSGGGNVSCASCHIDANTDFLAWNLSDGNAIPAPGQPGSLAGALGPNAAVKGPMVTQPLRGLVNFEVGDDAIQDLLFSNKPYHWRGDKGAFEQFNAAFVNLMAIPNPVIGNHPLPAFNEGIPFTDMTLYRDFVFSMHYPPNPDQPWLVQSVVETDGPSFFEDRKGSALLS